MNGRLIFLIPWVILVGTRIVWCDMEPSKPKGEATITSDELEMQDNGARTVFTGHVVLRDPPYVLRADRMVQTKKTGIVDTYGHVEGTWISETGEKLVAIGRDGEYRPAEKTTELWGECQADAMGDGRGYHSLCGYTIVLLPMKIRMEVLARHHVHMSQGPDKWATSDEARLDRSTSTLYLWGSHQVLVHWQDAKGVSDFYGDHGTLVLHPKKAQLIDHVHGHVIPL